MGGEFPITAISGDSGPRIFPLEIDEHDQLGAKDTKRGRSVTDAYCTKTSKTLVFDDKIAGFLRDKRPRCARGN